MLFSKYLKPYFFYIFLLFFFFSLSVNFIESLSFLNYFSYVCLHFIIIYLALYYYRLSLYLLYFLCGLGCDLLLINNQIGPHLLSFMILLFVFNMLNKYFKNLNSSKIYLSIIFTLIIIFFFEMLLSDILFNYNFDFRLFFKMIFICLIISYPVFIIFNKIDNFK